MPFIDKPIMEFQLDKVQLDGFGAVAVQTQPGSKPATIWERNRRQVEFDRGRVVQHSPEVQRVVVLIEPNQVRGAKRRIMAALGLVDGAP